MAEFWFRFCIVLFLLIVESRVSVFVNINKLSLFFSNILVVKLSEMEKVSYWWVSLILISLVVFVWRAVSLFWTIFVVLLLSLIVSVSFLLIFVFIVFSLVEIVCISSSLIVVLFVIFSIICLSSVSVVFVVVVFVLTIFRSFILICVLLEEVFDFTVNTSLFVSRILFVVFCSMLNATLFARVFVIRVVLVVVIKAFWLFCCIFVALFFFRISSVSSLLSIEFLVRSFLLIICEFLLIMEFFVVSFVIICCRLETISVLIVLL